MYVYEDHGGVCVEKYIRCSRAWVGRSVLPGHLGCGAGYLALGLVLVLYWNRPVLVARRFIA